MCNRVHKTIESTEGLVDGMSCWNPQFRSIKEEGYAWKVFSYSNQHRTYLRLYGEAGRTLGGVYCNRERRIVDVTREYAQFVPSMYRDVVEEDEAGFCCYCRAIDAFRCLNFFGPWFRKKKEVKVVHYRGGLGSFDTYEQFGSRTKERIMIVKEFKIIEK